MSTTSPAPEIEDPPDEPIEAATENISTDEFWGDDTGATTAEYSAVQ